MEKLQSKRKEEGIRREWGHGVEREGEKKRKKGKKEGERDRERRKKEGLMSENRHLKSEII